MFAVISAAEAERESPFTVVCLGDKFVILYDLKLNFVKQLN